MLTWYYYTISKNTSKQTEETKMKNTKETKCEKWIREQRANGEFISPEQAREMLDEEWLAQHNPMAEAEAMDRDGK